MGMFPFPKTEMSLGFRGLGFKGLGLPKRAKRARFRASGVCWRQLKVQNDS